ncbi:MAG: tRNA(His) guanylyltransferase Thg1 family protein [Clostridia bacterium]
MEKSQFEELCYKHRRTSDYTLDTSKPILMMLDGRSFSKFCKRFEKPFDDNFIKIMDDTAKYLCKTIQNAEFAFVQSDEISIYIKPCVDNSQGWFKGRILKQCSIASSMASSYFTSLYSQYYISNQTNNIDVLKYLSKIPVISFDCKVWNVPSTDEVIDWFKFRQTDCIKNSKNMFANTYCSHKELLNMHADAQIELVKQKNGLYWHNLSAGKKHGRMITRKLLQSVVNETECLRSYWDSFIELSDDIRLHLPFQYSNNEVKECILKESDFDNLDSSEKQDYTNFLNRHKSHCNVNEKDVKLFEENVSGIGKSYIVHCSICNTSKNITNIDNW